MDDWPVVDEGNEDCSPEWKRYYIQINPKTKEHEIHIEGCPKVIEESFNTFAICSQLAKKKFKKDFGFNGEIKDCECVIEAEKDEY